MSAAVTSLCICSKYWMCSSTLWSLVCSCKGGLKVGWKLYQTSNGDLWVLWWGQALCANSMMGRSVAQLSCWKFPQIQRYHLITWLTHSDSPSVCGWKVVDSFCLIPNFLQNSCVTWAVNCSPQSEIMAKGNPVLFQTLSTSNWLVCSVVMVLWQGDRIIALLWWLMTVRILSYPWETGRSTVKAPRSLW